MQTVRQQLLRVSVLRTTHIAVRLCFGRLLRTLLLILQLIEIHIRLTIALHLFPLSNLLHLIFRLHDSSFITLFAHKLADSLLLLEDINCHSDISNQFHFDLFFLIGIHWVDLCVIALVSVIEATWEFSFADSYL